MAFVLQHHPIYDTENFKRHYLITLDNQGDYKQYCFQDSDTEPKITLQRNITGLEHFDRIMNYLEVNPWSMMVGEERGFTVILDELDNETNQLKSVATTFSFNS